MEGKTANVEEEEEVNDDMLQVVHHIRHVSLCPNRSMCMFQMGCVCVRVCVLVYETLQSLYSYEVKY